MLCPPNDGTIHGRIKLFAQDQKFVLKLSRQRVRAQPSLTIRWRNLVPRKDRAAEIQDQVCPKILSSEIVFRFLQHSISRNDCSTVLSLSRRGLFSWCRSCEMTEIVHWKSLTRNDEHDQWCMWCFYVFSVFQTYLCQRLSQGKDALRLRRKRDGEYWMDLRSPQLKTFIEWSTLFLFVNMQYMWRGFYVRWVKKTIDLSWLGL